MLVSFACLNGSARFKCLAVDLRITKSLKACKTQLQCSQIRIRTVATTGKQVSKKSWTSGQPMNSARGVFRPEISKFLQKSSPTLLYQAPSSAAYKTGCYLLATFCFAYAGFNCWDLLLNPPIELSYFTRSAISSTCTLMTVFGMYCVFKVCKTFGSED